MTFGGSGIVEAAFNWFRQHLPDGRHILELGSGDVSTRYLSQHYQVTSVEDNPEFWNRWPSRYIRCPLVNGWYDLEVLTAELPSAYDLILVDGPTGSEPRAGFLRNLHLFRQDVPVVIDDTWRDVERQMALELARQRPGWKLEQFEQFSALTPP